MKILLTFAALVLPAIVFAKNIDFQAAMSQPQQDQAYQAVVDHAGDRISTIDEKNKADMNKIVVTSSGYQVFNLEDKKTTTMLKQTKKKRLSSVDKLEEDDFSRLESELNSLN